MKKHIGLIAAGLVITVLISGCGKTKDKDSDTVATSGNAETVTAEKKVIYGEVSDIAGNAITVKLIEMPEVRAFDASGEGFNGMQIERDEDGNPIITDEMRQMIEERMGSGNDGTSPSISFGGDGNAPSMNFGDAEAAQTMPEDGTVSNEDTGIPAENPSNGDDTTTGDGTDGSQRRSMRNFEKAYTGEEVDLIIPVGLSLTTMSYSENGIEETEMNISKLKTGDTVTVTYADDGVSIDKIVVASQTSGGGMFMPGGDATFFFSGDGTAPQGGFRIESSVPQSSTITIIP